MPLNEFIMIVAGIVIAAFILNVPFGYLRGKEKKFSFKWFLYIHLPIPFIFLLRRYAGVTFHYIPIIIMGAVIGQIVGARLFTSRIQ